MRLTCAGHELSQKPRRFFYWLTTDNNGLLYYLPTKLFSDENASREIFLFTVIQNVGSFIMPQYHIAKC